MQIHRRDNSGQPPMSLGPYDSMQRWGEEGVLLIEVRERLSNEMPSDLRS